MFKLNRQAKLFLQYACLYNVDQSVKGAGEANLRHMAANTFYRGQC